MPRSHSILKWIFLNSSCRLFWIFFSKLLASYNPINFLSKTFLCSLSLAKHISPERAQVSISMWYLWLFFLILHTPSLYIFSYMPLTACSCYQALFFLSQPASHVNRMCAFLFIHVSLKGRNFFPLNLPLERLHNLHT